MMLCAHCRTTVRLRVPGPVGPDELAARIAASRGAHFCQACGRSILGQGAGDRLMRKLAQLARFGLADGQPLLELARRRS